MTELEVSQNKSRYVFKLGFDLEDPFENEQTFTLIGD